MSATTAAFVIALCLIVAGVWMVHPPTALIVSGVLLAALAWTLEGADDKGSA